MWSWRRFASNPKVFLSSENGFENQHLASRRYSQPESYLHPLGVKYLEISKDQFSDLNQTFSCEVKCLQDHENTSSWPNSTFKHQCITEILDQATRHYKTDQKCSCIEYKSSNPRLTWSHVTQKWLRFWSGVLLSPIVSAACYSEEWGEDFCTLILCSSDTSLLPVIAVLSRCGRWWAGLWCQNFPKI